MDKLTVIKIIDLIDEHIKELVELPGNPMGRDQAISELKLLKKDIKDKLK